MKDIVTVSLRMPKDMKMALEAYAADMGVETSKVIRWILREHLGEEGYELNTPDAVNKWLHHLEEKNAKGEK